MNDLKDIAEITLKHFGADITVTEQYKRIEKKLNELEDLRKENTIQTQFRGGGYYVTQTGLKTPHVFNNIKDAVDKLYSLKANCEGDIGMLLISGGTQLFIAAERKLDREEEK